MYMYVYIIYPYFVLYLLSDAVAESVEFRPPMQEIGTSIPCRVKSIITKLILVAS